MTLADILYPPPLPSRIIKEVVIEKNNSCLKKDAFPQAFTELFKKIKIERANPLIAENFKKLRKEIIYLDTIGKNTHPFLNTNVDSIFKSPFQYPTAKLLNCLSNDFFICESPKHMNSFQMLFDQLYFQETLINKNTYNDMFVFITNASLKVTDGILPNIKSYAKYFETKNHMFFNSPGTKGELSDDKAVFPYCHPSRFKETVGCLNEKMEPQEKSDYGPHIKLYTVGPDDSSSPFTTSTANVCVAGLFASLLPQYDTIDETKKALYDLATEKEVSFPKLQNHKIYVIDPKELTVVDGEIRRKQTLFYTVSGQFPYGQWAVHSNKQTTVSSEFSPHNFMTRKVDVHFKWI